MDKFQLCELTGREKLRVFLEQLKCTNLQPTTDKYDEVDYFANFKSGTRAVFEIKNRDIINKRTGKFYEDIMLGDNKVDAIKNRISRGLAKVGFYACFHENHLFLFDVINCPNRIGYENCPATTAGENHNKVTKRLYYFLLENAWHYEFVDGFWCKITEPKYLNKR